MAVEYANQEDGAAPMDEGADDSSETTSFPTSILQGKKVSPGDVVRLEVVSVDDQDGTVTAKYATESEDEPMGGIEGAAAKFEA